MRNERRNQIPPLILAGHVLDEGRSDEVVVLNQRERRAIERAAEILEELRARVDPDGLGECSVASAETWMLEIAETPHFYIQTKT